MLVAAIDVQQKPVTFRVPLNGFAKIGRSPGGHSQISRNQTSDDGFRQKGRRRISKDSRQTVGETLRRMSAPI